MPLLTSARIVVVNSSGVPYALAKMYTYRAGTTTNLATYTTSTYGTAHANPIIADASGVFAPIYIDPSLGYDLRIIIKDSDDVAISGYDIDNIPRADNSFPASAFSGNVTVTGNVTASANVRAGGLLEVYAANPRIVMNETDRGTDLKFWDVDLSAGVLSIRTRTDADGAGKNILVVTRGSTTAISSIAIGNATDLPTITMNGESYNGNGTFTGTLTGMTASTTRSFEYFLNNGIVTLRYDVVDLTGLAGTSNTTGMQLTGLPAVLTPTGIATFATPYLTDNGATVGGFGAVSGTAITFGVGIDSNLTGFTNSGTKGLAAYFVAMWSIR